MNCKNKRDIKIIRDIKKGILDFDLLLIKIKLMYLILKYFLINTIINDAQI